MLEVEYSSFLNSVLSHASVEHSCHSKDMSLDRRIKGSEAVSSTLFNVSIGGLQSWSFNRRGIKFRIIKWCIIIRGSLAIRDFEWRKNRNLTENSLWIEGI
jgi:hypothetical protein